MKSTGSSTTNRPSEQPDGDGGASKRCPRCGGTVRFSQHYPVLTGHLPRHVALSPSDTDETERLRYVKAWVCENRMCTYSEVISASK